MKNVFVFFFLSMIWSCCAQNNAQTIGYETGNAADFLKSASESIRINQLGYFPTAKKTGSIAGGNQVSLFNVIDLNNGNVIQSGSVGEQRYAELSSEYLQEFDFSDLTREGFYQLKFDNGLYSYPFEIGTNIYDQALYLAAKSYYYQRVGTDITEEYASDWKRPAGHPDTKVLYHPSTGKTGAISSPGGWYDAGDYGKYVTNGSFSAGQLLFALERYPELYPDGSLNIPESGNGINDLLDELKYETDWIATMQDVDGGVFHKLTTANFAGAIMPHQATEDRYIMPKSSVAAFDFAAFLAKMARNYKNYDKKLADKWRAQAEKAWKWGVQNPEDHFKNPKGVATGEYGDDDSSQEQFWAAAELFTTTGNQEYLEYIKNNLPDLTYTYGDGWQSFMRYLGVFTLLNNKGDLPPDLAAELEKRLISSADDLANRVQTFDYRQGVNDFQWASNSDVQNSAYVIAEAWQIAPKQEYVDAVLSSLNYLFGHNATGYCFMTGIGDKPPMNIHHRPSKADGIVEPVPGFVCGGPNDDKQDANDVDYPENASQMHSYRDVWESYASNEVCLNWNSPTPYLLKFAIENGK